MGRQIRNGKKVFVLDDSPVVDVENTSFYDEAEAAAKADKKRKLRKENKTAKNPVKAKFAGGCVLDATEGWPELEDAIAAEETKRAARKKSSR